MPTKFLAIGFACATLFAVPSVSAQQGSPNTTPTTVSRVTLVRIKTGHTEQFWADMRQNLKPVYEAYKRAGVLVDYSVATKGSTENENDWSVRLTLTYRNYAALDSLAAKTGPITLAHYKSAEQRTAAGLARSEHGVVVASYLERDHTLNDWK